MLVFRNKVDIKINYPIENFSKKEKITKITTGNIYFLREKQDKFMEKPEESDYNMFHWRSCSGNCLI